MELESTESLWCLEVEENEKQCQLEREIPNLLQGHGGKGEEPNQTPEVIKDWLAKFGYLPPPDPVTGQLQTQEPLTKAVKAMQRFSGLEETGILDEATLTLMKTPRCSLPDLLELGKVRRKRYTQTATKWNKRNLSWRVRTFPKDSHLGHDTIRALMFYALKVWSDITPLNFHEVRGDNADIQIDFSRADHHDGYPFDGPGGTVAHAFFPGDQHTAGDTHFDDDEYWTFRSADTHGMDLFAVAVHEFGHAIGLSHISTAESIMRPYFQGPVGDPLKYDLPYEDKVRIWQLYGVRESVSPTRALAGAKDVNTAEYPALPALSANHSSIQQRRDGPDRCNTLFDAVAQIRGEAFFFKGKYFWRLNRSKHLVSFQPAQIHRFWRGLPPNMDSVDAVYERATDHKIVFFKGSRYWVFKDNNVEEGYPRPLTDFSPSLESVDAAFYWVHDSKTYLFKDGLHWRFDENSRRMDLGYPKETTPWKGIPSSFDDAMRWLDGAIYFFKGKDYWKVTESSLEAVPGYPQSTARDWLACSEMQSDSSDMDNSKSKVQSRQGHHDLSRSGNGYEVCSCSASAESLRPWHTAGLVAAVLISLQTVRITAAAV
ncbi:matrix metalloproteinase-17 [Protopterus annectens]|uniref:matrix metalloproteinase-17 n=1 Tax=Protopterus annectens TaxID=7888 RepID=UPI001CFB5A8C|nr:matrix metalloproteinase-17 [Protopterus annectens]